MLCHTKKTKLKLNSGQTLHYSMLKVTLGLYKYSPSWLEYFTLLPTNMLESLEIYIKINLLLQKGSSMFYVISLFGERGVVNNFAIIPLQPSLRVGECKLLFMGNMCTVSRLTISNCCDKNL